METRPPSRSHPQLRVWHESLWSAREDDVATLDESLIEIITSRPLPPGAKVFVEFLTAPPGQRIGVDGEVLGHRDQGSPGMRIRWLSVDSTARAEIQRLMTGWGFSEGPTTPGEPEMGWGTGESQAIVRDLKPLPDEPAEQLPEEALEAVAPPAPDHEQEALEAASVPQPEEGLAAPAPVFDGQPAPWDQPAPGSQPLAVDLGEAEGPAMPAEVELSAPEETVPMAASWDAPPPPEQPATSAAPAPSGAEHAPWNVLADGLAAVLATAPDAGSASLDAQEGAHPDAVDEPPMQDMEEPLFEQDGSATQPGIPDMTAEPAELDQEAMLAMADEGLEPPVGADAPEPGLAADEPTREFSRSLLQTEVIRPPPPADAPLDDGLFQDVADPGAESSQPLALASAPLDLSAPVELSPIPELALANEPLELSAMVEPSPGDPSMELDGPPLELSAVEPSAMDPSMELDGPPLELSAVEPSPMDPSMELDGPPLELSPVDEPPVPDLALGTEPLELSPMDDVGGADPVMGLDGQPLDEPPVPDLALGAEPLELVPVDETAVLDPSLGLDGQPLELSPVEEPIPDLAVGMEPVELSPVGEGAPALGGELALDGDALEPVEPPADTGFGASEEDFFQSPAGGPGAWTAEGEPAVEGATLEPEEADASAPQFLDTLPVEPVETSDTPALEDALGGRPNPPRSQFFRSEDPSFSIDESSYNSSRGNSEKAPMAAAGPVARTPPPLQSPRIMSMSLEGGSEGPAKVEAAAALQTPAELDQSALEAIDFPPGATPTDFLVPMDEMPSPAPSHPLANLPTEESFPEVELDGLEPPIGAPESAEDGPVDAGGNVPVPSGSGRHAPVGPGRTAPLSGTPAAPAVSTTPTLVPFQTVPEHPVVPGTLDPSTWLQAEETAQPQPEGGEWTPAAELPTVQTPVPEVNAPHFARPTTKPAFRLAADGSPAPAAGVPTQPGRMTFPPKGPPPSSPAFPGHARPDAPSAVAADMGPPPGFPGPTRPPAAGPADFFEFQDQHSSPGQSSPLMGMPMAPPQWQAPGTPPPVDPRTMQPRMRRDISGPGAPVSMPAGVAGPGGLAGSDPRRLPVPHPGEFEHPPTQPGSPPDPGFPNAPPGAAFSRGVTAPGFAPVGQVPPGAMGMAGRGGTNPMGFMHPAPEAMDDIPAAPVVGTLLDSTPATGWPGAPSPTAYPGPMEGPPGRVMVAPGGGSSLVVQGQPFQPPVAAAPVPGQPMQVVAGAGTPPPNWNPQPRRSTQTMPHTTSQGHMVPVPPPPGGQPYPAAQDNPTQPGMFPVQGAPPNSPQFGPPGHPRPPTKPG